MIPDLTLHHSNNQEKEPMILTQKNKYNDQELCQIFFSQRSTDSLNFLLRGSKPALCLSCFSAALSSGHRTQSVHIHF